MSPSGGQPRHTSAVRSEQCVRLRGSTWASMRVLAVFFVHTLLISWPGVCQFCPTTSRVSSDVQNLQPAPSIVDGRRKKLCPNLRRFVVDFDLKVSEGRVARNVLSESMAAQ